MQIFFGRTALGEPPGVPMIAARWLLVFLFCWVQPVDAQIAVVDDAGHVIALSAPALRVITLAPHAAELIVEVGALSSLVAVSEASDFPSAVSQLPTVGGSAGFDLEAIVALHPDLVVAWSSGNSSAQIEALRNTGIAVFQSDPQTVEQIATSLERFGRLTGHAEQGAARARELRQGMAALRARQARKPTVRVFYQLWDNPLYTLGNRHLLSRMMEDCGGSNIFADVDALAPQVSAEAVLSRHPDVIVTAPQRVEHTAIMWRGLGLTETAFSGIDGDWLTRPTSRVLLGANALCAALDEARAARPLPASTQR